MPVMDGIKAAEEIRKIEADNKLTRIPIVILSGEKLNEQMRKDIDDDSPKPYVRNDIFIKMVKLLNKKPLVDTAPLSPSASPGKSPGSSASSLVLVLAKHAVVCKPLVSAELPASPPLSPASALPSTPPSPALAALVLSQEFSRAHAVVCVI
jgi:CheY-like chemotaxis protein